MSSAGILRTGNVYDYLWFRVVWKRVQFADINNQMAVALRCSIAAGSASKPTTSGLVRKSAARMRPIPPEAPCIKTRILLFFRRLRGACPVPLSPFVARSHAHDLVAHCRQENWVQQLRRRHPSIDNKDLHPGPTKERVPHHEMAKTRGR